MIYLLKKDRFYEIITINIFFGGCNMALTVYKQIAKDALMSWNGLSEEEATKVVQESSNEELESQVYAQGSIDAAIKGFQKYSQEYQKNKNG